MKPRLRFEFIIGKEKRTEKQGIITYFTYFKWLLLIIKWTEELIICYF